MSNIIKVSIGLAGLAFVMAVVEAVFKLAILGVPAEGFSRACTNLALIAIAVSLCFKEEPTTK